MPQTGKVKQHTQLHWCQHLNQEASPDGDSPRTVIHVCKQTDQEKQDSKAKRGNRRSVSVSAKASRFKVGINPHLHSCNADDFSLWGTLEETHGYARCLKKRKEKSEEEAII